MNDAVLVDRIDESLMAITLNRPERLNAIDGSFIEAMHAALDQVEADPDVRAVVLSGAGRGFCAGADLQETVDLAQQTTANDLPDEAENEMLPGLNNIPATDVDD